MAHQFSFNGNARRAAFTVGQVHTEDGFANVRAMALAATNIAATATITISAVVAGTASLTFTPGASSVIPNQTVTVNAIATDTTATLAVKLRNAIALSPLGYYYSVSVSAAVITLTAKTSNPFSNIGLIAAGTTNNAGITYAVTNTSATASTDLAVGRLVSYSTVASNFPSQNNRSIPECALFTSVANAAGVAIWTPEVELKDDNSLIYRPGIAIPVLTDGVVSFSVANGVEIQPNGNVFAALSGTFQGQIAATAIDGTFAQLNLPGAALSIRPYAGRTTHGGVTTQKFRVRLDQ